MLMVKRAKTTSSAAEHVLESARNSAEKSEEYCEGSKCIAEGALIQMESGKLPIRLVSTGDKIVCVNLEARRSVRTVRQVCIGITSKWIWYQGVKFTPGHLIRYEGEWCRIETLSGNEEECENEATYNLDVDDEEWGCIVLGDTRLLSKCERNDPAQPTIFTNPTTYWQHEVTCNPARCVKEDWPGVVLCECVCGKGICRLCWAQRILKPNERGWPWCVNIQKL